MRTLNIVGWSDLKVSGQSDENNFCKPFEGAKVHIDVTDATCNLPDFPSNYISSSSCSFNLTLGEATCYLDRSLELAIYAVSTQESVNISIVLPEKYAVSSYDHEVQFFCTLKVSIIENVKRVYDFLGSEKLLMAKKYKSMAVKLMESSEVKDIPLYTSALLLFSKAVKWLSMINPKELDCNIKQEMNEFRASCYNNIALMHLKLENYVYTVSTASTVLLICPNNVKALYKRGVANMKLQNYELAAQDLSKALEVEPLNLAVIRQLKELHMLQGKLNKHYSKQLKKMFS